MSEINYRQQWADGEIEAGTLLDAIDAMAQRCRELEHMLKHARMDADTHYADALTLRAEVEQLRIEIDLTEDSLGHAIAARNEAYSLLRQIACAADSKSIKAFLTDIHDLLGTYQ